MPNPHQLPPTPRRFWNVRRANEDPPNFMYELIQRYGDVVRWRGFFDVYFVNHPDHVRRVLSPSYEHFSKDIIDYRVLSRIMGNGLVSNDGPHWVKQRKLMQPMFANRVVNGFDGPINSLTKTMLDTWDKQLSGGPIWVDQQMGRLTFQIVGATLFGSDIDQYADEVAEILELVNLQTQEIRALLTLYSWLPTPYNIKWRKAKRRLDDIVYTMIAARRREGDQENDILDRLIGARDPDTNEAMDKVQMRDEVVTLMLAGHETSSMALAWTLYLLAQHPEVAERLAEALDEALAGSPAGHKDLNSVPYLKQVVQESMRIYPPVWAIGRRSLQAEVFGDYEIPAGAYVAVVPYALHRHAEFWPDPERFDPDRFQQTAGEGRHSYCYLPFAAGPRACIGLGMAMLEVQLVLAQIVQRYRIKLVPGHPVEAQAKVTLKQRHGLPLIFSRRD
ncbi:MAG: cytochrome P450 [Gammaproteobacteria bacterium]|jgi:cytochrome P450